MFGVSGSETRAEVLSGFQLEPRLPVIPAQAGIQASVMREREPAVYMMANKRNGTLYIGVTSDLSRRAWQHKTDEFEGFTKKYGLHTLVWYEWHDNMTSAITREKQMKKWNRAWKISLIAERNPQWLDLYNEL